uniref:ATP synthase subunit a n=1 Tax=Phatnoma laciniatum TaxID=1964415 RepID=A0A343BT95_9HEMI|nr:ATP synthase F0 subunit 6 [Phatnoma laciniatum]ARB50160.1 ATP synthase F0 subunit 6 [Phatnoma laciniatum]
MMMNLFSSFDPATSLKLSMNWLSMITILFIPQKFWLMSSRILMLMKKIMTMMKSETEILLSKENKTLIIMMMTIFMFILINNFLGLMPYIFCSTSHLVFNLSMALPLWITLMLFGWYNKTKMMLIHTVPTGTPTLLMPFMSIIETVSNMIRPVSLSVRLTANMMAGHLLMTLIEIKMNLNMMNFMNFPLQMLLLIYEMAISTIQAYVFMTLFTLYTKEVTYE